MLNLIIIGAGGFAKSVVDSIDKHIFNLYGFIDDYKKDESHLGYPILGDTIDCIENPEGFFYFIAIGDNKKRSEWYTRIKNRNLKLVNIIDKSSVISPNASIGEGCFVGKLVVINNGASIGNNTVINTRALIEHGCHIGNNINISTNTVLNGDVCVDDMSFIGSCSVINGQSHIGKGVIVGSGSVVINDIQDYATAVGIPAKVIKIGGKRV